MELVENKEEQTVGCHLTGKFNTESPTFIPSDYFKDFHRAIEQFFELHESDTRSSNLLDAVTDPELLSYEGEPAQYEFKPYARTQDMAPVIKYYNRNTQLNDKLETVKHLGRYNLSKMNPKYSVYQFTNDCLDADDDKCTEPVDENVLITFKIYRPFLTKGRTEDIKIQQEIVLSANSTLRTLEKEIKCSLNHCGLEDLSEDKEPWSEVTIYLKQVKQLYPSSFFFMNNTFYGNGNTDLSEVVRKFLEKNKIGIFPTADWSTPLKSMKLQVGRPYLYQHVNQCEHIVMISDMRLHCSMDPMEYPLTTAVTSLQFKKCLMCSRAYARWLVTNFLKLTMTRAFLCHRCFLSYCYVDGHKAGDFQAYHYMDIGALL